MLYLYYTCVIKIKYLNKCNVLAERVICIESYLCRSDAICSKEYLPHHNLHKYNFTIKSHQKKINIVCILKITTEWILPNARWSCGRPSRRWQDELLVDAHIRSWQGKAFILQRDIF